MDGLGKLTPTEFVQRWPSYPDEHVVLLDVREPHELSVACVAGTLNIPMSEIPARTGELSQLQPIVVMCHGGIRSRQVAQFLVASGFGDVFNLEGGIDAWATEIDSSVPRY